MSDESGQRLGPGSADYSEIVEWLHEEAALLDSGRFDEWLALLADELTYRVPVRIIGARSRADAGATGYSHYDETRSSLATRVRRLNEPTAWSEQPRSRTRHFVTNVRVRTLDGEFHALSYLLLLRSRGTSPDHEMISGERHDVLRRTGPHLLLVSREVVLDQSTLSMTNLSTFL